MSFSSEQARSFIGPLIGKTTSFVLNGRGANLSFAQVVMALFARTGNACTVFDLDAFYSSNSDRILGQLPAAYTKATVIQVPDPGSSIEKELPRLFATNSKAIIVDSLNTLHHLLSLEDGSSRSRKLSFAMASLSYVARTGGKAVIFTMYRREGFGRTGPRRSISGLSDMTASVDVRGADLSIRCEHGTAWPGGWFSIRIP